MQTYSILKAVFLKNFLNCSDWLDKSQPYKAPSPQAEPPAAGDQWDSGGKPPDGETRGSGDGDPALGDFYNFSTKNAF